MRTAVAPNEATVNPNLVVIVRPHSKHYVPAGRRAQPRYGVDRKVVVNRRIVAVENHLHAVGGLLLPPYGVKRPRLLEAPFVCRILFRDMTLPVEGKLNLARLSKRRRHFRLANEKVRVECRTVVACHEIGIRP